MLKEEEIMEIGILHRQGLSNREISRQLGISRNTVRRYLDNHQKSCYQRENTRMSKLEPWKEWIKQRVLQAHPHCLPATVIAREIRALGYDGGLRQVQYYVASLKPNIPEMPLVRFETPAGEQMQVDWAVFRRGHAPLSAFIATLCWSRYTYVEFVTNERFETLRACHFNAFEYFHGITKTILYDNMKTVVQQRNAYGAGLHRFHSGLWALARDLGFTPRLCQPYRAQTKGKVERFIRYLRNSFYLPLSTNLERAGLVLDVETANIEVLKWLRDIANQRVHQTTQEVPHQRWKKEVDFLQPYVTQSDSVSSSALPIATIFPAVYETVCLQHSLETYDLLLGAI
jgi:transposase